MGLILEQDILCYDAPVCSAVIKYQPGADVTLSSPNCHILGASQGHRWRGQEGINSICSQIHRHLKLSVKAWYMLLVSTYSWLTAGYTYHCINQLQLKSKWIPNPGFQKFALPSVIRKKTFFLIFFNFNFFSFHIVGTT